MKTIMLFIALLASFNATPAVAAREIAQEIQGQYEYLDSTETQFVIPTDFPENVDKAEFAKNVQTNFIPYIYGITQTTPNVKFAVNNSQLKVRIKKYVFQDPNFQNVLNQLAAEAKTKPTQAEQMQVLVNYLRNNNFRYCSEFSRKYKNTRQSNIIESPPCMPDQIIRNKNGICTGYANLVSVFCDEIGIRNIKVTGYACKQYHCWNLVEVDGEWMVADATLSLKSGKILYPESQYNKTYKVTTIVSPEEIILMKYGQT